MQAVNIDYERVTAGLKTKSDKIRALGRSGASTADIARFLDIRYQHVRNVLLEAGLYRRATNATPPEPAVESTASGVWVEMDASGHLVLPIDLATTAGLTPGRLHIRRSQSGIEILSRKAAVAEAQALLAPYIQPGRSIVDEFIADRHREADHD